MSGPRWRIYCEGGVQGSAEYVRLLFEEAGVLYVEITDADKHKSLFEDGELQGWPCLEPPMVERIEGMHISETNAMCKFLSRQLGLVPITPLEEAKADQVFDEARKFDSAMDGFADDGAAESDGGRFVQHFNNVLKSNKGGSGLYVAGMKPSYADFAVMHVMRKMEAKFPDAYAKVTGDLDLIRNHKGRMESRPKIEAYFKTDRYKAA